jgi:hypothetical protein
MDTCISTETWGWGIKHYGRRIWVCAVEYWMIWYPWTLEGIRLWTWLLYHRIFCWCCGMGRTAQNHAHRTFEKLLNDMTLGLEAPE